MLRRGNDYQLVAMNQHNRQSRVRDWQGHNSEVNRIVDHRFQNLGVIGPLDIHGHIRILPLEFRKNFGKDVKASALIRSYDNLATWHALGFGDGSENALAGLKCFFSIFLEQLGADVFFKRTDLRRDRRLCAEAFLRGTRKAGEASYLEKGFQLVKVHNRAFSCQLSALRYFRRKTCVQNKIGKGTNLFVPPMLLHPCPSERARPRGIRFPTFLFVLALPFPAICLLNQKLEAFVIALIKTINFPLPRVANTLKRPAKGKIVAGALTSHNIRMSLFLATGPIEKVCDRVADSAPGCARRKGAIHG